MFDLIIIGAGPAGLTAAVYAIRAGLKVLVLESLMYGGQLGTTPEVENFPSIQKISGWQLAANIYEQALAQGADIRFEAVLAAELTSPIKKITTSQQVYTTRTVIIANGARRKKLGCPGEAELTGNGVSYCATCDGAFFQGQDVAVIGGGNTALEDALFLSKLCPTVHLVHRRDTFRSDKILLQAVSKAENIQIHPSCEVLRIEGTQKVSGVTLQQRLSGETYSLEVKGVFIAIGLVADNQLFASEITLDAAGYIQADESCCTNLPGVYAAGDTRTKFLRQIITAASDGAIAATQAAHYLNTLEEV